MDKSVELHLKQQVCNLFSEARQAEKAAHVLRRDEEDARTAAKGREDQAKLSRAVANEVCRQFGFDASELDKPPEHPGLSFSEDGRPVAGVGY